MQEGRWETVTPSQFQHERDALKHVQNLLPDTEPYRAWSNFTFTAQSGHVCEVDLLVAAPSGLYLIEIKSLNGRLTSSGSSWILISPAGSGSRTFDNPLHLADLKAKRLKALLQNEVSRQRINLQIPFIQAAVFLSNPGLDVSDLPDHQLHWVFGPEPKRGERPGTLPPIWSGLLARPPRDERRRVLPELSQALPKLLHRIGIARSRRHLRVGSWQLDPQPFDSGPTWQDHLAHHAQLPAERRRIRIYLVERNAVEAERASIARAARREMLALHGISHPGIVQVDTMEPHEAGPALIFRHDPRAQRLDHYLALYSDRLDVETRTGMIRQLAEAMAYVHGRHLHHRALSARSVLVMPGPRRRYATEEEAWLHPRLRISDWQSAIRGADSTGNGSTSGSVQVTPTTQHTLNIDQSAEAYLAPEQALMVRREVNDLPGEGRTRFRLANVRRDQNRYSESQAEYESSLAIVRAVGDRYHEGLVLWQLGVAAQRQGEHLMAQARWQEALEILDPMGCTEASQLRQLLAGVHGGDQASAGQTATCG